MDAGREPLERAYREEATRIRAALAARTGDVGLAEDAVQDAFVEAIEHWPRDGVPASPGGWLATTARRKALDRLRRDKVGADKMALLAATEAWAAPAPERRTGAARRGPGAGRPAAGRRGRGAGRRGSGPAGRRRAAEPGVRLLPPGADHRRPGRAHAARRLRPDDRPDRGGVPGQRADDGPAHPARPQDAERAATRRSPSPTPMSWPTGSPRSSPSSTSYSTRATWRALAASPPAATWPPRRSR